MNKKKCKDCKHYAKDKTVYGRCALKIEKNEIDKLKLRNRNVLACRLFEEQQG